MKRAEKIFLPSSVGERHEARGRGADLGYWKVLTKILAFFSKFDEFRLYSIISDYKIPNNFCLKDVKWEADSFERVFSISFL